LDFVCSQEERPVLFPVGAVTTSILAAQREAFSEVCDFLVTDGDTLAALNDKELVAQRCREIGIRVPVSYTTAPEKYPVIIKPRFGEGLGIKAADRYFIAHNYQQFLRIRTKVEAIDPHPIVQEMVSGSGFGACLLFDRDGRLIDALCHRRIREYPVTGGPSTCCESFYDEELIQHAYQLLKSYNFTGMAMVEFKGVCLLEVNPRVWGSFPLTDICESRYVENYVRAARGETVAYSPGNFKSGVRMRFQLNDLYASLAYLKAGRLGSFAGGIRDHFKAAEALQSEEDPMPYKAYLRTAHRR
jgi:predicted ATP-grasp superfamily ATP-dependent carboligase